MTTALNHVVQPIWRPNTYFAIEMETIDRVNGNDNFVKNHVFGFRTKGPIGHYHKGLPAYIDLENENKHEEFQLKDLQQYLDFDKSFPHPGSKMLDAKPLYYNNIDFSLIFKQQYTYHMFNDWAQYGSLDPLTSKIELVVKGSVPDQDVENPQEPTWIKVPVPIFFWYRNDLAVLDAVINETPPDNNCIQLAHQFAIPYFKIQVQKSLKPETLYTAIWKCNFGVSGGTLQKEEVWRYGFQSSRYGSLNDQLQSYVLSTEPGNERKALYSIPVVWNSATQIEAVKELNSQSLSDTTLYDKYAISFDRLMNGILKVGQIPATDNFEVNVFKEGAVIKGILVRSPEPFIDPRLPKTEIDSSLVLSLNVGGIPDNTPLRVAFSKDTSQVFISNDNMDIAAGDLNLNFKFKLFDFDTNAFVVKQQANITIDLTTV
ncbi:MAG TPA: hypothetical protein DIW47_07695 [Bacteroidetes bacterium]|nr:hypothetical protein [Bacteroidota bacterium]